MDVSFSEELVVTAMDWHILKRLDMPLASNWGRLRRKAMLVLIPPHLFTAGAELKIHRYSDIYCYVCDDSKADPEIAFHLSKFGINVATLSKTEKNMTELVSPLLSDLHDCFAVVFTSSIVDPAIYDRISSTTLNTIFLSLGTTERHLTPYLALVSPVSPISEIGAFSASP